MENKYYIVNEDRFLFTEIDDEGVLFDVESNEYLNLNSAFCSIFKYLRENLGLQEIKELLMREYAVCEKDCEEDLLESVEMLKENGLIHEKGRS